MDAGMPKQESALTPAQALLGSADADEGLGDSPALLKDNVASPGGTTIVGLAALEEHGARGALIRMVRRAAWDAVEGRQR